MFSHPLVAALLVSLGTITMWTESTAADEASRAKAALKTLLDDYEENGGAREMAPQFFQLADKYPDQAAAVDALVWVANRLRTRPEASDALDELRIRHLRNKRLTAVLPLVVKNPSQSVERLLLALMDNGADRKSRSQACIQLARMIDLQADIVAQLAASPEKAARVVEYYGKDYGSYLKTLDRAKTTRQQADIYRQMKQLFADVKYGDGTLGKVADQALFRVQFLTVGQKAPDISGQDIFGKRFKLSDYRGRVVMLSFWGHW